jgi:hypothetical protein
LWPTTSRSYRTFPSGCVHQGLAEPGTPRLEQYLDEDIAAASIASDKNGPLFRTAAGKTGELTRNPMWQRDAYAPSPPT